MKKSTLMLAMGAEPPAEDAELGEEMGAPPAEQVPVEDADLELDAALDAYMDPSADPDTRREAFRKAVAAAM